jgi:hypothetical protein
MLLRHSNTFITTCASLPYEHSVRGGSEEENGEMVDWHSSIEWLGLQQNNETL